MDQEEIRQFIIEAFEENYELMRLEGGHAITGEVKQQALEQVLLYWEKLHELDAPGTAYTCRKEIYDSGSRRYCRGKWENGHIRCEDAWL